MSTWLSTDPRQYFLLPPLLAAASTASEMAMPREPGESGCDSSTCRPALVALDGLAATLAPYASIIERRYGLPS